MKNILFATLKFIAALSLLIAWLCFAVTATEPFNKNEMGLTEFLYFVVFIITTFGLASYPFIQLGSSLSDQTELDYRR